MVVRKLRKGDFYDEKIGDDPVKLEAQTSTRDDIDRDFSCTRPDLLSSFLSLHHIAMGFSRKRKTSPSEDVDDEVVTKKTKAVGPPEKKEGEDGNPYWEASTPCIPFNLMSTNNT